MHTFLLNIGFVKMKDGTYYNSEVQVHVKIDPDEEHVIVRTPKGNIKATIEELEDTIVDGGFGDF
jgi:hypothetical protein